MKKKLTIQDIADMAGVSKAAVSRYMNDGYISKEKAEKIKTIIEETGYRGNFFAKRLKTKESKLIGVVLPRIDSVTVGKLLSGIYSVMDKNGYQEMFLVSKLSIDKEIRCIKKLYQQGVDGIIVDSVGITEEHLEVIDKLDVPVIFTGQQHQAVNSIKVDDLSAGLLMGRYLRDMGHKKAIFAGVTETDIAVGIDRKNGFYKGFLTDNPEAEIKFMEVGFNFQSAYEKAPEMVKGDFKPTVIAGATDNISLGVLRYLHEKGVRVPEEISLVGFGGYAMGTISYPALTTIEFDYKLLGQKAALGMLELLNGDEITDHGEFTLEFIPRESVADLCSERK